MVVFRVLLRARDLRARRLGVARALLRAARIDGRGDRRRRDRRCSPPLRGGAPTRALGADRRLRGSSSPASCWSGAASTPSNSRKWQSDVAVLPYATFDGDQVTLHNIRNFDYRTELDYTPHYYDKTFDLNELDEVDLIAVYWMGDAIAHIMLSFGFAGRDYVTISIETRKEVGESYDTIRGFFRQYELIYIVGDERDLIRLRTNYRKNPPEDVYLYRTAIPPANARRLFLDYLREINELKDHPAWYNTGTTNCTTNVYRHTHGEPRRSPLLVEDPAERLRAGVRLRARRARHQPALRRAEAALLHQPGRAGGRQGPGFLAADPREPAEAAASRAERRRAAASPPRR